MKKVIVSIVLFVVVVIAGFAGVGTYLLSQRPEFNNETSCESLVNTAIQAGTLGEAEAFELAKQSKEPNKVAVYLLRDASAHTYPDTQHQSLNELCKSAIFKEVVVDIAMGKE